MKFPLRVKHRGKVLATIYGKNLSDGRYRVAWTVAGARKLRPFSTYSEAKRFADDTVRDLAAGLQFTALSRKEVTAALSIRDALDVCRRDTGRTLTAIQAVTQYLEASRRVGGRLLSEVVDKFLATVATVQRKDLAEAVAEFIESRKHLAEAKDGERARMSPVCAFNVAMWLNQFAQTFPGHAVCDLTKEHLNTYIGAFKSLRGCSESV